MKIFLCFLMLCTLKLAFPQNQNYTPKPPAYKINGKRVLYEGYIINRNGAKVYTENMDYTGFCFDYLASLPVFKENDTLVLVASSRHDRFENDEFFYVHKKYIGKELTFR
ncbi:hypothetical protein [Flavobacterium rhizosphaerae]|uniref:Uncharacterized protein n=1 Tax=Flavobacterium rhizosphaerae TaxID=3163298 RepID=A0ABW8YWP2_9FLAO